MKKLAILLALVLVVAAVVIGIQVGRNNTLSQEKIAIQTQLNAAQTELDTTLQNLTQAAADRDKASGDFTQLQTDMQAQVDAAQAELVKANESVTMATAERDQAVAERDQATANLATVQSAHDLLVQEQAALTDQLTQANNVIAALTTERTTLATQAEEATTQLAAVTEEKMLLTSELDAAQSELIALKERQAVIEATLAGTESADGQDVAARIDQLIADRDTALAELAKATEDKISAEAALAALTQEKAAVDEALAQAIQEKDTAQAALKATTEEKAMTDQTLAQQTDALKAAEERLATLTADKTTADETLTAAQNEKAAAEEALAALQAEKATADEALTAAQTEKAAAEEALAALRAEKATADEALTAAQTEKAAAEEALAALQVEKAAADAKVEELTSQKDAVETELAALQTEQPLDAQTAAGDLTVYHTNDVHARVTGNDADQIGYAKLSAILTEARAQGGTLLLDAGDALHGMAFAGTSQGQSVVDLMNQLGYDAMTPGNHDFNYGFERLKELEKGMAFPLVNANILLSDGTHAFTPYVVKEVAGRRIAIVGAANPSMKDQIHPARIEGLTFAGIEKVEEAVQAASQEADVVIILAHWGASAAYQPNSSVLAAIPGVSLVVDGHSHTQYDNIEQQEGAALIVSAGDYLTNIGRVTLAFGQDGHVTATADPITFEEANAYTPDAAIEEAINAITQAQSEALSEVLGVAAADLDGERANVRTMQTNLGNLGADAFLQAASADMAFTNGGGIRRSIPAGNITRNDVVEVFPFGNSIVVLEVTGLQIRQAMEHGLRLWPEQNGGFPQIAGATLTFDGTKEAGSRVVEMTITGQPLEDDRLYTLVTNDFLAAGGDGYEMFKDSKVITYLGTMDEVLGEYIKSLGTVPAETDTRITLLTEEMTETPAPQPGESPAPAEPTPTASQAA